MILYRVDSQLYIHVIIYDSGQTDSKLYNLLIIDSLFVHSV